MIKKMWYILLAICELILIAIFLLEPSKLNLYMIIIMQLEFIAIRKGKYIKNNLFRGARWVRRSVYFIPYILPLIYFSPKVFESQHIIIYSFISIVIGMGLIIFQISEIKNLYNKELMLLFPPMTRDNLILELYSLIGSAVLQEFFYRIYIISSIYHLLGYTLSVFIAAIFFVAEHMMHSALNNSFRIKDYVWQFIMSVFSGILFINSGAVIVPILIHVTFNGAIAISYVLRFYWSKKIVEG